MQTAPHHLPPLKLTLAHLHPVFWVTCDLIRRNRVPPLQGMRGDHPDHSSTLSRYCISAAYAAAHHDMLPLDCGGDPTSGRPKYTV